MFHVLIGFSSVPHKASLRGYTQLTSGLMSSAHRRDGRRTMQWEAVLMSAKRCSSTSRVLSLGHPCRVAHRHGCPGRKVDRRRRLRCAVQAGRASARLSASRWVRRARKPSSALRGPPRKNGESSLSSSNGRETISACNAVSPDSPREPLAWAGSASIRRRCAV